MGKSQISFIVNDQEISLEVDPRQRLVHVLRGELRLTGTKEGCDTGHCGSCSVIVDGALVNSCLTPVGQVAGKKVTTIEGIGTPNALHPLQQAFIDVGVVQCGYCAPGMIVAAKALLDRNPSPTRRQIKKGLANNLCRCSGYVRMEDAVLRASAMMRGESVTAEPVKGPIVGGHVARLGDKEKVTGVDQYAADLYMEGMLHARVLRSPHPHARIVSIDTTRAESLPGVEAVLTAKDIPGINRVGIIIPDQPVLCDDKVRQVGDPVALVAATSEAVARRALSLIHVQYEPLEAVSDPFTALQEGAPQIYPSGNLMSHRRINKGDISKGFAEADVITENAYSTPIIEHAYIEPEAGLAHIDEQGRVTLRVPTHSPHGAQKWAARVLGIDVDQVRVIPTVSGGDHGGKSDTSTIPIYSSMALLAYKLRKPIRFVYSRKESFVATSKRHPFFIRCRMGATRQGKLTALQVEAVANTGAYASTGPLVLIKALALVTGPYYIPHVWIEGKSVYTNIPFCGSFRGFGAPQVCFAIESQMDITARELGIDPLEFRLLNAFEPGSETATRQILGESVGIKQTLLAVKGHYEEAKKRIATRQKNGSIRTGVGVASMWAGIGLEETLDFAEAYVELRDDGMLRIYTGSTDSGQGTYTVLSQIAAEEMQLPMEFIEVISGDTSLTPNCLSGSASKQTFQSGNAVLGATRELKETILGVAVRALEEKRENLYFSNGLLLSRSDPTLQMSLKVLAALCREAGAPLMAKKKVVVPLSLLDPEDGHGVLWPCYTFATQVAEVETNIRTGKVKVRRVIAAHDVGKAIHPRGVELQIEGAILIGIGFALKEEFVPGKTLGFAQYPIPTIMDAPEVVPIIVEVPEPTGPFGAKGMGEATQNSTAPAIINAIYHATGARIFDLPAKPGRLLEEIKRAKIEESKYPKQRHSWT